MKDHYLVQIQRETYLFVKIMYGVSDGKISEKFLVFFLYFRTINT